MGIISKYIEVTMSNAVYEQLEDGSWFATIPHCPGVWASKKTRRKCKRELREVLEEWLLISLRDNDRLQKVCGIDLGVVPE